MRSPTSTSGGSRSHSRKVSAPASRRWSLTHRFRWHTASTSTDSTMRSTPCVAVSSTCCSPTPPSPAASAKRKRMAEAAAAFGVRVVPHVCAGPIVARRQSPPCRHRAGDPRRSSTRRPCSPCGRRSVPAPPSASTRSSTARLAVPDAAGSRCRPRRAASCCTPLRTARRASVRDHDRPPRPFRRRPLTPNERTTMSTTTPATAEEIARARDARSRPGAPGFEGEIGPACRSSPPIT